MPSSLLAPPRPKWVLPEPPDRVAVDRLGKELHLPEPICRLLVSRGYAGPGAVGDFLRPRPDHLHPASLLAGVDDAVERLGRALADGETILVHGDYDADGVSAAALATRVLKALGGAPVPFVPHRTRHGYDFSTAGVLAAQRAGATLVLTCDCGIAARGSVKRAGEAGIDVIVTDHHTPGPVLPEAVAVVNPARADCPYPNQGLCGTGVVFKLLQHLAAATGYPGERLLAYLDLVALATVADLVPLTGENRVLVRWGLKVLRNSPNPGLRALLASSGLTGKEVTAGRVGFVLAPRINAAGRVGDAREALDLLTTDDPATAETLARALEERNRRRRELDRRTLEQVRERLEREYEPERDRAVVLAGEGWHPGVIGIVASRVVEEVHRPTVLIALDPAGESRGSARSIPGFHLYDAMRACAGELIRFGGHKYAAGCSIEPARVAGFAELFQRHARAVLAEEPVPELRIDLELPLGAADPGLCRMLAHAAPFGVGNPTPLIAARGVRAEGVQVVGNGHLRLRLVSEGCSLEAIGFGLAHRAGELAAGPIDAAFRLDSLQAKLVDFRPTEPD
ncbi:MAG: single-stranded-DNA-specific exonuclease RecJ [Longimicrobiaceae bacterium]